MGKIFQGFSNKVCSTRHQILQISDYFSSFWDCYYIIHQQLVAVLRGHMRFVYTNICFSTLRPLHSTWLTTCSVSSHQADFRWEPKYKRAS